MIFVAASALISLAAVPGFARASTTVRAEVPFAFYAGDLLLPPGSYTLTVPSAEPELLTIQERNGKEHEILLTVPEELRRGPAGETKLVFDRYGKNSFLTQIWIAGQDEERVVPKSEVERERAVLLRREEAPESLPGHF
jgi:hypothetical protein